MPLSTVATESVACSSSASGNRRRCPAMPSLFLPVACHTTADELTYEELGGGAKMPGMTVADAPSCPELLMPLKSIGSFGTGQGLPKSV
jgi:hypothetical protein